MGRVSPDGQVLARHTHKVKRVVEQLRGPRAGRSVSLRKKTVSHQVPKAKDKRRTDERIDIGGLDEILAIDRDRRTCTAEPGVTFNELVRATLPLGLLPIIVPEHKTITIGGAVAGCSIESMSFRHGGFHDTCLEYEVITARGEVLRCTPQNEHRLIFQMVHGSFGTLGIVSKLTFKLIEAQPFVRVDHERHATRAAFKRAIWRHFVEHDVDYMDGMIHGPSEHVVSLGRLVDEAPYTSRYDWLKAYVESTLERGEDYLATPDYLFRYDRGVTSVFPKSPLGRAVVGKLVHSDNVLRLADKLHRFLPTERPRVIVDVFVPFSRADAFLDWYERAIGHYPVWCVPYRRVRDYEWLAPEFYASLDDRLFLDFAIYDLKQPRGRNLYKEIEDELLKVGGMKTLISYNYYDRDVFWSIFNKANYDAVKRRTDPHNLFRDLYSKTCRATRGLEDVA